MKIDFRYILLIPLLNLFLTPSVLGNSRRFYTVQIASPQNEFKAKNLTSTLRKKGIDTFEAQVLINGKKHYRICTGFFENLGLAKAAQHSLIKQIHRKDVFVQQLSTSHLPGSVFGEETGID